MRSRFLPEGRLLHTPENEAACASRDGLRRAMEEETVLEGVAQLCDCLLYTSFQAIPAPRDWPPPG